MRDILFKAKRIDNGEWVEGYYVYHIKRTICAFADCVKPEDEQHVIMQDGFSDWNMPRDTVHYDIDPNTLCQYTGLKDKNGKKIWENDIVELYDTNNNYKWKAIVKFGNPNATYNWGYQLLPIGQYKVNTDILLWVEMEDTGTICEVVGNIFDNPELLNYADNEASQQAHQEVLKSATE